MLERLVSVIIPNYNRAQLVEKTIQSVINQTYKDFEILVLDDCSDDGSKEVLDKYASTDSRIKVFYESENKFAPYLRNKGLSLSKGEFIQFLDSDDLLYPDKFLRSIEIFKKNEELQAVICQSQLFGEQEGVWGNLPADNDHEILLNYLKGDVIWGIEGPLWKRSFLCRFDGYKEDLTASQEKEFHIRALSYGPKLEFIYDPLVKVRIHEDTPSMRRKFSDRKQRISSFRAFEYSWKNLAEKGMLDNNIRQALRNNLMNYFRIYVIEKNFYLIRKVFIFQLRGSFPKWLKVKILLLGYPLFIVLYLFGKGKNILIKHFA